MSGVAAEAEDWSRLLGPNGDNQIRGAKIARSWSEGPKELWQAKLGRGYGGAAIRDGEVYLLDRDDGKNVLRCYALDGGKELWSKSFDQPGRLQYDGSRATPTVGEERVYAMGPFGNLYCLDRKSHELVWTKNMMKEFGAQRPHRFGFAQSPLLYKDKLIVSFSTGKGGVVALDKKTGAVLWNNGKIRGETYCSPTLHTIAGEEHVVALVARYMVGLDPESGGLKWVYRCPQLIPIPTVTEVSEGRFFVTGGYREGGPFGEGGSTMIEVKKAEGKFVAKEQFKISTGSQIHPAILIKDHLYVNLNTNTNVKRNTPNLSCLDLKGEVLWKTEDGPALNRGGVIAIDGLLLVLSGNTGKLHLVEPKPDGFKSLGEKQVFAASRGNSIWAPLAFSKGKLVVRDQGVLKCLDLTSG